MNFVLHGYPVSGGITVGYAHLVATARLEVAHYEIAPDAIDAELARFDRAMQMVQEEQKLIVVAHDLSPADMILFKRHRFGGFVTDVGGVTSHTAIVARSLAIPAIVGLHHAFQTISEGEMLIVDGERGLLVINPDSLVLAEYREPQAELKADRQRPSRLKKTRATTQDGTPIEHYANIELPQDTSEVLESGAEGVGLFRTEFMFLNRKDLPAE